MLCCQTSFLNIFPKTMWTCTDQTLVLSQNLEFSDLTCSLFTPFLCGNLDCSNVTHSESWLKALLRELQLSANNRAVERIIFGLSNAVLKTLNCSQSGGDSNNCLETIILETSPACSKLQQWNYSVITLGISCSAALITRSLRHTWSAWWLGPFPHTGSLFYTFDPFVSFKSLKMK